MKLAASMQEIARSVVADLRPEQRQDYRQMYANLSARSEP